MMHVLSNMVHRIRSLVLGGQIQREKTGKRAWGYLGGGGDSIVKVKE